MTDTITRYQIEADGFTRSTPALPGWEGRIRGIVTELGLRPGTEVRIYRVYGHVHADGTACTAGTVDHRNVRRVYVPAPASVARLAAA